MALQAKATHAQTRAHNSSLVLRAIYDSGPLSRADLARRTDLTRTTVSEIVGELLAEGLVEEVGRGPSTGGRAPILVRLIDDARHVVALDLGELTFTGAVVNLRGVVRATVARPVGDLDGEEALALVHELADELVATTRPTLLGIGVGTPGVVDASTGTIRWAVNLDWQDLPLGRLLAERYGVPVSVANDSRAAAVGIHLFDGEQRAANLIAIKVGRGIGAGIIVRGELFNGDGYGAGEIGHVVVEDDGAACRCGRFGCLETVASSLAIVRRVAEARRLAGEGDASELEVGRPDDPEPTLGEVAAALRAGDEPTRRIVVAAGRYLGRAIAGLIGALNIERVVLLGSVAELGEPWLAAVRDEAGRRALGLLAESTTIVVVRPDENVVALGATALLLTDELGLTVHR